jgi:hypothetical protein
MDSRAVLCRTDSSPSDVNVLEALSRDTWIVIRIPSPLVDVRHIIQRRLPLKRGEEQEHKCVNVETWKNNSESAATTVFESSTVPHGNKWNKSTVKVELQNWKERI